MRIHKDSFGLSFTKAIWVWVSTSSSNYSIYFASLRLSHSLSLSLFPPFPAHAACARLFEKQRQININQIAQFRHGSAARSQFKINFQQFAITGSGDIVRVSLGRLPPCRSSTWHCPAAHRLLVPLSDLKFILRKLDWLRKRRPWNKAKEKLISFGNLF